MKTYLCALVLGLLAVPTGMALAQGRPQGRPLSTAMTCAQAAGLVNARGAVVMSTGPYTYDRYVQHRGFCTTTETIKPDFIPTRDSPTCFIGYRCVEITRGGRRF
ncbi:MULTISPECIES: hypothetical protein [unclassified Beijerinckia]|uniref:hypothetical protein n=1 Tax=unclassified Beijerinckia TaxID=2638183 RepID=UPI000897877E|nr:MULTISPECIES: hypothetical protein [unclassified Beijerinckia]MDH7795478.1 hypothetical protein [Beijerinckia sp. GAS462]SEC03211.1 hypothetical protein SAMN05443249_1753 [Beijerinckia sp. 28-YEA-48]